MFPKTTFGILLALLWQQVSAVDKTRNADMISKLDTAATQLDRLALVPNDDDWVFDFTAQKPYYSWAPGGVTNMNAATFAAGRKNGLTSKRSVEESRDEADLYCSGHGQSGTLLHAATSSTSACCQLRRCYDGQYHNVYVGREWRSSHHDQPDPRQSHSVPRWSHAHDGQYW